ncbi:MFS transporter [Allosaccharopolyspora coralli]|uniref:MFS transporter n=2 Tax=Allosaccharopolyspora coralli TaxID=2665642 RepID=A0A5Q3QL78_9PSEU|nr:MFS transporter [Allosaccharopolyspora coralli]
MSSWASRLPEARDLLGLTPGQVGTLLLAMSGGAMVAMAGAGTLAHHFGSARVVGTGAILAGAALAVLALGTSVAASVWVTALGMVGVGLAVGVWDVAMNVEAASVEHRLGYTIMPRFHAGFSLGTVLGAAVGAAASAAGVSVAPHLLAAAVVVAVLPPLAVGSFLAPEREAADTVEGTPQAAGQLARTWKEPRTLLIGLMVLALALTEGTANDWLALAMVDGHQVPPWVGATTFAVFLTAMTLGRFVGTHLLDRYGRVLVLRTTMTLAIVGVLITVLAEPLPLVAFGVVLWGLGASLGFPIGMSAAADDPDRAAPRVSVVSAIGYTAFLAGPPVLGYLGDHFGTLQALLLIAILLVPSLFAVSAARPPRT